jgi:hypothetical protein
VELAELALAEQFSTKQTKQRMLGVGAGVNPPLFAGEVAVLLRG